MTVALVIGHTGQDGSFLMEQLHESGVRAVGVSRREVLRDGDRFLNSIDLSDIKVLGRLLDDVTPDQIYYLAARHHSSQESEDDPMAEWRGSWRTHVEQFAGLLETLVSCRSMAKVFYASSSRIFGQFEPGQKDERSPIRPACVYGITKASGMLVADRFRDQAGLAVSTGIMFNHESPRRSSAFLSQKIAEGLVAVRLGEKRCLEVGDLGARVDWGYAPDYVRAMRSILDAAPTGDYVVATGVVHTVADMVRIAADRLGLDPSDCVRESANVLRRPSQYLYGDASLLRRATGWVPSIGFERMVEIMVEDAARRRSLRIGFG